MSGARPRRTLLLLHKSWSDVTSERHFADFFIDDGSVWHIASLF